MDKVFTDVRIFNPLAPTNSIIPLEDALKRHEQEKKRCYNERVLEVEQSSFCPLVFSVMGSMGNEAEKFYRRTADLIAQRTNQRYAEVVRYIRQRLSFTLLRTCLVSLRGHKGTKVGRHTSYDSQTIDINLLYTKSD